MKRILIAIALSLVCVLSFSQERINTEKYLQFDKTTKALKKVMGYDGVMGEWKSKKNYIHNGGFGDTQKFNKLTVKTIIYNDTLYYALIRNYTSYTSSDYIVSVGDVYKYEPGGGSINTNAVYFFTTAEFEQIFHLDKKAKNIYSFKNYHDSSLRFKKSNISTISDYILKSANKNNKKDFMQIRIADDGKMVRFLLPYHKDELWLKDYDIFPECYFEMPLKDFYKWLKPIMPTENIK